MGNCCAHGEDPASSRVSTLKPPKKLGDGSPKTPLNHSAASVTVVAPGEEMKARARRRALNELIETLHSDEHTVPTMKWRGQYLKVTGIGPSTVTAIAQYIQGFPAGSARSELTSNDLSVLKRPAHHIRTLDLRALRAGDDGFVEIMSALLDDTLVERVLFAGNSITDDGVARLVSHIDKSKSRKQEFLSKLKVLSLSDNMITSAGIAAFAAVAPLLLSLEHLEVGRGGSCCGNDLDDVCDTLRLADVAALTRYIQCTPKLGTFVYRGNGNYHARSGFSPAGMTAFVDTVVGNSALKVLHLQDCFTTKWGLVGPAPTVAPRAEMTAAGAGNGVDESWMPEKLLEPIQKLADALTSTTIHLTTLALRFPLSDEAVRTLAAGLAHAPNLQHLTLRGCDLSGKALGYIGGALATNKVLRLLDVSYQANTISHPAYLAELRSSSKRRSTSLSRPAYVNADTTLRQNLDNSSSELQSRDERQHPLRSIICSLHQNRSLRQLLMLGVNITTDDVEELCSCVERSENRVIKQVWYTNGGDKALRMKLDGFLKSNIEHSANRRSQAALLQNSISLPLLRESAIFTDGSERSTVSASELGPPRCNQPSPSARRLIPLPVVISHAANGRLKSTL